MLDIIDIGEGTIQTLSNNGTFIKEGYLEDNIIEQYEDIYDKNVELAADDFLYFVTRGTFYIVYSTPVRNKSMPFFLDQEVVCFSPYLETPNSKRKYIIHFFVSNDNKLKYKIYIGDVI